nr:hypothetical protein Iba_chr05eCG11230 [Ipomoea batatas]
MGKNIKKSPVHQPRILLLVTRRLLLPESRMKSPNAKTAIMFDEDAAPAVEAWQRRKLVKKFEAGEICEAAATW